MPKLAFRRPSWVMVVKALNNCHQGSWAKLPTTTTDGRQYLLNIFCISTETNRLSTGRKEAEQVGINEIWEDTFWLYLDGGKWSENISSLHLQICGRSLWRRCVRLCQSKESPKCEHTQRHKPPPRLYELTCFFITSPLVRTDARKMFYKGHFANYEVLNQSIAQLCE